MIKEFTNNHSLWTSFLEEMEKELEYHRNQLEKSREFGDIREAQGKILAVRRIMGLRDRLNEKRKT